MTTTSRQSYNCRLNRLIVTHTSSDPIFRVSLTGECPSQGSKRRSGRRQPDGLPAFAPLQHRSAGGGLCTDCARVVRGLYAVCEHLCLSLRRSARSCLRARRSCTDRPWRAAASVQSAPRTLRWPWINQNRSPPDGRRRRLSQTPTPAAEGAAPDSGDVINWVTL